MILCSHTHNEEEDNKVLYSFFINNYAVLILFVRYFVFEQVETIVGCFLTVGSTCLSYFLTMDDDGNDRSWDGATLSWVLLSIVLIKPLMESIKFSFQRREDALQTLTSFRSSAQQFYLAHATWDWPTNGRYHSDKTNTSIDQTDDEKMNRDFWLNHSDKVLQELLWIGTNLTKALTTSKNGTDKSLSFEQNDDHSQHNNLKQHSVNTIDSTDTIFENLLSRGMVRLCLYTEDLKRYGLEYPEAIRIRNMELFMTNTINRLHLYKTYTSTPQTLRSFARVFAVWLPPMYGPYFAEISRDSTSSIFLGVSLAIITSMVLTSLLAANIFLEDPFYSSTNLSTSNPATDSQDHPNHIDGISTCILYQLVVFIFIHLLYINPFFFI